VVRCRKELASLRDIVMKIEPIAKQIKKYRHAINMMGKDKASNISGWLKYFEEIRYYSLS
jgi:hypothetical protein